MCNNTVNFSFASDSETSSNFSVTTPSLCSGAYSIKTVIPVSMKKDKNETGYNEHSSKLFNSHSGNTRKCICDKQNSTIAV